jgi:histidine triad (HIT) family protein
MVQHAPTAYQCPFCLLLRGTDDGRIESRQGDIVYRDGAVTAFICSRQFATTPGHVLVVPDAHHENLYDLPDALGARVHAATRAVARAMKAAYGCTGVTTMQSNEPAGNQTVRHYHVHVLPRFAGDNLYAELGDLAVAYRPMPPEERARYAARLRARLGAG